MFEQYGYFDERLERNQDIEFNARIISGGGKILLAPAIKSYYMCNSTLKVLLIQNFRNGLWNIKTTANAPGSLSFRHFVPLLFVVSLLTAWVMPMVWISLVASYITCNLCFSVVLSIKHGFKYMGILPVIFGLLHCSYGIGSLIGIVSVLKGARLK